MPLTAIVDGDLERYIADNRTDEGCWFFVHIPKTAGSSFRRELADMLRPNHNVNVARDRRQASYEQKIADATKDFNDRLAQSPCRFASGHVPVTALMEHVEDWQKLKLITMLRDPAVRMISDYRYQTTPAHPVHREFVERFPTFEDYLATEWTRNRMFRFLRPSSTATLEECIAFVVERFAFVGAVEMYPLSVRLVTRLMGQERSPSRYLRKTVANQHNQFEVTPELVERVRELNRLDVALYNYFHGKLGRLRQPEYDELQQ